MTRFGRRGGWLLVIVGLLVLVVLVGSVVSWL